MDLATLEKIITDAGGEEYIYGFIFDNSGRKMFINEDFDLNSSLVADTEILKFIEKDLHGYEYIVYKSIEDIQSVMSVKNLDDKKKLAQRYITG